MHLEDGVGEGLFGRDVVGRVEERAEVVEPVGGLWIEARAGEADALDLAPLPASAEVEELVPERRRVARAQVDEPEEQGADPELAQRRLEVVADGLRSRSSKKN